MRFVSCLFLALTIGTAAAAQDGPAPFDIGADAFRAGSSVVLDAADVDDLFAAGGTVVLRSDLGGSAHVAGRRVTLSGSVGGDVYALGMDVTITGDVAGDATVMGQEVAVGAIGGDLRISGSELTIAGPVGGYGMIAGEEVTVNGVIAGDVALAAGRLEFGPTARIDGLLTLYEKETGDLEVPDTVIDAARIERRQIEEWEDHMDMEGARPFNPGRWIAGFLMGVIVLAGLAALVASLMPEQLAAMRRRILDRPFGTLWLGFLTLSAIAGSALLLALTLIGIVVSPAAILLAVLTGFAGYVIGVYAFGVGLMLAIGRDEPRSIADKALAAGAGAVVAGILALIPFLGWLFVLALTLAGVGAICMRVFSPHFFSENH